MTTCRRLGAVVFWLLVSGTASAHVFAPALLEIREKAEGRATVRWKQPIMRRTGSLLQPLLPEACEPTGVPVSRQEGTGVIAEWEIACDGGLVGRVIRVEGIAESGADVLLRLVFTDGRSVRHILTQDEPAFVVPHEEGKLDVMGSYLWLGVEHILSGWDHLLFVLALVLLVGERWKLFSTITAFTVGHSVTLALAVLGIVNVPQQPVEAAIALSIYVLAVELTRTSDTLIHRLPWLMAGVFGLLHGLGFAGALTEAGLPVGDIPLALFSFNVGIELGQLAFIAVVLMAWAGIRAFAARLPEWAVYVPAYGIGSLGAFWFFERLARSIGII